MKKVKTETIAFVDKAAAQIQALWGRKGGLTSFNGQITFAGAVMIAVLLIVALVFRRKPRRWSDANGYVLRKTRSGGCEYEHRGLAEEVLGRSLEAREVVHHINGRPSDNRIKNLCVMERRDHDQYHEWYRSIYRIYGKYPRRETQLRKLREHFGGELLIDVVNRRKRGA